MKKGGYQIIDLSAYKFTNGESQIIKNVYNIIKNTKKVVLISGLTVDETEYHDMFTVFMDYETFFCGLAQYEGNNICFVANNDGSVVVNVASAKTPIAYLYNGVQLPAIPEWDKEIYPYATINSYKILSKTKYNLTLYKSLFTAFDESHGEFSLLSYGAYRKLDINPATMNEWNDLGITEPTGIVGTVIIDGVETPYTLRVTNYDSDYIFWSNHSFYGPNGEDWINATEPIPVYE